MSDVPTAEELADLFDEGTLAREMGRRFKLNEKAELQLVEVRCVELHNSGTRDLLSLIESDVLQRLNGSDFFMATHFFCQLLPELEAEPARMMACVEALVTRGGDDLAANQPNAAFRDWCKKDPGRASEVISSAYGGDDLANRYLTFALEATHAIPEARQIALAYNDVRRLSAITALGRMEDDDPASRGETLVAFSTILESGTDDNLCANMLRASAAIFAHEFNACSQEMMALIDRLTDAAGEFTVHQAAHVLWAYRNILQPELVSSLLKTLKRLNPANKETVNELDLGLQTLLEDGHDVAAIAFVAQLFSSKDDSLKLAEFDSFISTLFSGPPERVSRVVVQWLKLGEPRLCEGLSKALQGRGMKGPPLDLRAEDISVSPSVQLFICRKAIGWFFFAPTTAASVLVSVLRVCDAETAHKVQRLLVETLLLNYGGVRDYLESLASEDAAKVRVDQALAENEAYITAMRDIPPIKELEPSEHHRRIERLRMSDQMRDAHRQAQSQSALLSLVKRSVLLYGNRSINFIKDGENTFRSIEMDLKPHSISFEMPRMEIIDPINLDYMLRVFRAERMTP